MNLVIGLGEVGQALAEILDCDGRDIESWSGDYEVLHIAFPYFPGFEEQVRAYEQEHSADLVVVHSTVPVGTCDPNGWVHSPVRGRHPHLASSMRVFPKWFGGERAREVDWPYETRRFEYAADTEAAKLWELTQFGLQVRVTQAIYEYCREHDLDPEVVYRGAAIDYNQGYSKLGDDQFMRPVLAYQPGNIGGHCILPSMGLLDHPLARIVENGL